MYKEFLFAQMFFVRLSKKYNKSTKKHCFMTGEKVKTLIIGRGYNVAQVAEMIGTSQQNLAANLKHTDVRSGLLEKIADALGIPLASFYGEGFGTVQTATGNNNTQVAGSSNTVASSDAGVVLEILKLKDEQLLTAMRQTTTAQEQMGRLIEKFCSPGKSGECGVQ